MNTENPRGVVRKQLRSLIETGLQRDYAKALASIREIIENWEQGRSSAKDAYMRLFKELKAHDKRIAQIYNNQSGSRYFDIVVRLLMDGTLAEEELRHLPDEARAWCLKTRTFISGLTIDTERTRQPRP